MPADFDSKRDGYYDLLGAPMYPAAFNAGLSTNTGVRLRTEGKNRIRVAKLEKQPDPPNTAALKREIARRWSR